MAASNLFNMLSTLASDTALQEAFWENPVAVMVETYGLTEEQATRINNSIELGYEEDFFSVVAEEARAKLSYGAGDEVKIVC